MIRLETPQLTQLDVVIKLLNTTVQCAVKIAQKIDKGIAKRKSQFTMALGLSGNIYGPYMMTDEAEQTDNCLTLIS
jgi:hypothetical protein